MRVKKAGHRMAPLSSRSQTMKKSPLLKTFAGLLLFAVPSLSFQAGVTGEPSSPYQNFKVSVYVCAREVQQMKDPAWTQAQWARVTDGLKVDKGYLETYPEKFSPDPQAVEEAKKFFKARGIETAGGIATCVEGWPFFVTFSYADPGDRKKLRDIVEFTAKNFDEIILDDFFFYNTKGDADIAAKGTKSW